MDPLSIFSWQASKLRKDLESEAALLGTTLTNNGPYGPFARKLHGDILAAIADLDALLADSMNGGTLRQRNLSGLRDRAGLLFGEALTLRTMAFIRENKVDRGMCAVADKLLAELARAVTLEMQHVSTVAEAEYFGASTRVIRLRYPAASVWDLPVLAHEFIHWFGPLWQDERGLQRYPLKAFLDKGVLGNRAVSEEYFCDLLAVFLLGPAYVYTCVLLRFDPTGADDGDTHPADAARAWWVLRVLRLLADSVPDSDIRAEYRQIAATLESFWKDYTLRSRGRELAETEKLNDAAEDLFATAKLALPGAAYRDPSAAWGLVRRFKEGAPLTLQTGQMRDLLNACWFLRQDGGSDLKNADHIDAWAVALAKGVTK